MSNYGTALLIFGLLTGCATPTTVVLLPGANGKLGAVAIQQQGKEVLLDQPYAAGQVSSAQAVMRILSAKEAQQLGQAVLNALPPRPQSLLLYFKSNAVTLVPESELTLKQAVTLFRQRPAAEINLIGHADRYGDVHYNETLSKRRAEAVRSLLIQAGIPGHEISYAYRGDREPLTTVRAEESRNRRVEINLR